MRFEIFAECNLFECENKIDAHAFFVMQSYLIISIWQRQQRAHCFLYTVVYTELRIVRCLRCDFSLLFGSGGMSNSVDSILVRITNRLLICISGRNNDLTVVWCALNEVGRGNELLFLWNNLSDTTAMSITYWTELSESALPIWVSSNETRHLCFFM